MTTQPPSSAPTLRADVASFLTQRKRMLIGGQWLDSSGDEQLAVYNPSTGAELCTTPDANDDDVDRAVNAARTALESGPWPGLPPCERERLLWRLADLIERDADALAQLESLDTGKPLLMARHVDIAMARDVLRYMAGWATKLEGTTLDVSTPYAPGAKFFAYTRREPVGVCAQIIPWNFPLLMAAFKLGPVLASGCTSVLKPAELTPLTALWLGRLILEAGYPAGVVNIVTGRGNGAGAALVDHPGIDKIAFTGSTAVGQEIGAAAARGVKRVTLELGGKSPVIILPDADLEQAIAGAASAIFFNMGEVCVAGSRLYAHRSVFDKVLEGMVGASKMIVVGEGFDPATQMGPLISAGHRERVCNYVQSGREQGARIIAGGDILPRPGYFIRPTVLTDVKPGMRVMREEIFGPVVAVTPFDALDEVIELANDSPYGLAASVWTRDVTAAHRAVGRLKAGTVWVNCHGISDPNLPFGGFKRSGLGRELGRSWVDHYTEVKAVCIQT